MIERSGTMLSVLIFTANWKKWYSVLRYHKGFGLFDSMRFGLWLARGCTGTTDKADSRYQVRACDYVRVS